MATITPMVAVEATVYPNGATSSKVGSPIRDAGPSSGINNDNNTIVIHINIATKRCNINWIEQVVLKVNILCKSFLNYICISMIIIYL